ncbi:MAG: hypothetical protein N7Q72_01415 [Spiroplasma sp. Tabriz.8]|nr:hypothetical protein [Spiroplasma sp. Tabriz.8]
MFIYLFIWKAEPPTFYDIYIYIYIYILCIYYYGRLSLLNIVIFINLCICLTIYLFIWKVEPPTC